MASPAAAGLAPHVLCLAFTNTVGKRIVSGRLRGGHEYMDRILGERLADYAALVAWAERAGQLTAENARLLREEPPDETQARSIYLRAIALRESLYRLLKASIEVWEPEPADLAVLNREMARASRHERLVHTNDGYRTEWVGGELLDRVLWNVVRSAVELLTSPALKRIGQCAGKQCGWLFYDSSRPGRRRWCQMADCGNAEKVRRFRQRRA